ncbi:MAG: CRISPR-associated helicase Cas3' [Pyramidobacter sp.]|jgi:CRISPR-associated endonuclease/helicase Cas3
MEQTELDKIWGKFDQKTGAKQPLIAHLTDVAAVFEHLVKAPLFQRHFQRILGSPMSETLHQRLCVLALWHDFGKISPKFQIKYREIREKTDKKISVNHIKAAFNLMQQYKTSLWKDLLESMHFWENSEQKSTLKEYLIFVILSHHGVIPEKSEIRTADSLFCWKKGNDIDPAQALKELMELSRHWYPQAFSGHSPLPDNACFQHLFAGTLMLADWIASDRRLFPYCGENDVTGCQRPFPNQEDSLACSRQLASKALATLRWEPGENRPIQLPDFKAQFGFSPNDIQQAVDRLSLNSQGGLYILEAETGSGKTEAALRLYTRLLAAGYVDGLYFANPLRFAATQIFERLVKFSDSTFGQEHIPVTLAVPGYLRVNHQEGLRVGRFEVDWKDINDRAIGWYAEQPKRFLAAPIAAGTIDQALLAAMRVPHAQMRAAALQRSLLVIDEVHSSDAYMSRLICGLIELFRRVGGHVLLMSATLGSESAERYLKVWNDCGQPQEKSAAPAHLALKEAVEVPYPRLTSSSEPPLPIGLSARSKSVSMQCRSIQQDPCAVAQLAAHYAASFEKEGPCILILRNSVRQARKTFRELRRLLPAEKIFSVNSVSTLHHSRYSPTDRQLLDREVERRFGKESAPFDQLRNCCVLVATQTLEQSLDVDFDLIITDLCPADVLLQRIGRLFRHHRRRPEGFCQPQCVVLLPDKNYDWLLTKEARSYGYGEERAYANLLSLAATWRLLEEKGQWTLPEDNRFLVEKSTHGEALKDLAETLGADTWQKALDTVAGSDLARRYVAGTALLKWSAGFKDTKIARGKDMECLTTRLGVMDLSVECATPVSSPLKGKELRSFSIPAWLYDAQDPALQTQRKKEDGTFIVEPRQTQEGWLDFMLGSQHFYYGIEGLLSQFDFDEFSRQ